MKKAEESLEYTGSYYDCQKCKHHWKYDDDRCPNCGNDDWSTIIESCGH